MWWKFIKYSSVVDVLFDMEKIHIGLDGNPNQHFNETESHSLYSRPNRKPLQNLTESLHNILQKVLYNIRLGFARCFFLVMVNLSFELYWP